ncbi:glycosyltransferase 87 family protein [Enemella dayhoffiae]|uniref:glycosyltransferase 87 family protein n=1 Tax=Enemella dayhoffiae TaxID=2016507 RepID=UPI001596334A|nr:glycosyltransferase 87 family protein [Enemella dayhoffiae]
MVVTRRLLTGLGRALLPILAACYAVASIRGASVWPWQPWSQDLEVYVNAARFLVRGEDFYTSTVTFPYIYPPIAAVLAIPFTWLPWWLSQLIWASANGLMTMAVLRRLGLRPWWASVAAAAVVVLADPFLTTIRLGQLGILLLTLVLFDVLGPADGRRRRLPGGMLIGLATGLKLTPAVFIVYLFLVGRRRDGLVAIGTFVGTILLGLAVAPGPAAGYWGRLAGGDSGANPDAFGWIYNLSVSSAAQRFLGIETGTTVGLALGVVMVVIGLAAAWRCWRIGHEVLGLGILGLISSLANPIAWSHHLTWLLPLGYAAWRDRLPVWTRMLAMAAVLWCLINPQWSLGGAPWAQREIFEYSIGQKWFAAGPNLLSTAIAIAVLFLPRSAAASSPSENRDSPWETHSKAASR